MKFNFPKDKKTETVTMSLYEKDIKKIRTLAEKYKCTQQDIYKTLINEALDDYEEQFGSLGQKEAKPSYSVKRDFIEAGDSKREEVLDGEEFNGGGDLRTKEEKYEFSDHKIVVGVRQLEEKANDIKSKKLPKDWYKKEVLENRVDEFKDRKPLPQNFGKIAYCNYLLCDKKRFNLEDGIEVDNKKFCSEKCYEDWLESTKDLR